MCFRCLLIQWLYAQGNLRKMFTICPEHSARDFLYAKRKYLRALWLQPCHTSFCRAFLPSPVEECALTLLRFGWSYMMSVDQCFANGSDTGCLDLSVYLWKLSWFQPITPFSTVVSLSTCVTVRRCHGKSRQHMTNMQPK